MLLPILGILFGVIVIALTIIHFTYGVSESTMRLYSKTLNLFVSRKDFYSEEEKVKMFPLSSELEKNHEKIRDEYNSFVQKISQDNYNVYKNFSTTPTDEFYNGWNTIPLKTFGRRTKYANYFPETWKLVDDPDVLTCIFSVIKSGKKLDKHTGPFGGILRYHLGIIIPPENSTDKSSDEKCFISVNDKKYFWKNGEGVLFDETYEHYVENNTSIDRVVLFIDVAKDVGILKKLTKGIYKIIGMSPDTRRTLREIEEKTKTFLTEK